MADPDQSAGADLSIAGSACYHFATLEHDDSAELQDQPQHSDEFIEQLSTDVGKVIDGIRRIKRRGDRDMALLNPLEKSLNQIKAALRNLKQNVEIPEVQLEFNEHIKQIVETARAQGRRPNTADLGELVQDSEFLNSLQNGVNRWVEAIRKVTRIDRDPSSGTALQEATFWMNFERALGRVNEIRESDEVIVTLEALKAGKRFHAFVTFNSDTGLKEMLAVAADYNQLMKDIPLSELLASSDLASLHTAIWNILTGIEKIRLTKYPVKRALQFFMTISTDFCEQIIQLLKPRLLMHAPMTELEEVMTACGKIWTLWDDESDKMLPIFHDMAKKQRTNMKLHYRNRYRHNDLKKRLEELHKFRKQHEQLSNVISRVLRFTGANSLESFGPNPEKEVTKAYDAVKEVNYLDLSQAGQQAWESSMQYYKDHISRIETQLASRLRDQLGGAKNADEMFSIFSRYNALFVRPHIRCAIREYQTTLIDRVKADIVSLQETILDSKKKTMAVRVASNYDIPDFSANVMWLRQIEYQLNMNMKRIEDVLGEGWTNHLEGKELKKECDMLRQKLNTAQMFKEWSDKIISKCQDLPSDKLFAIEKQQRDGRVICQIRVNFSPDSIKICKEVRNLKNMGFRIGFKIMSYSHNISVYYPYAISLLESVRVYESTNEISTQRQSVEPLVANHRKMIQDLLQEGYKTDWGNFKLESYASKLADSVSNYQEKVTDLIEYLDKIDVELSALDRCQYKGEVITQILGTIQKTVDQMSLNNYSNLSKWIENLDKTLEPKLAARVEEAIHVWTTVLKQSRDELEDEREANIVPEIQLITLDIRVVAQQITAVPSLEKAKATLFEQFFNWHAIITEQPRISSPRFLTRQQNQDSTYKDVLMKLPKKQQVLNDAYKAIHDVLNKTNNYVDQWTNYQALWDLPQDVLFERLGADMRNWKRCIKEIKKARQMVDSPEAQHQFFPFVVSYDRVQSKIAMKYEIWRREVLQRFGISLGNAMQTFFTGISKSRNELEHQSVDSGNDTVALITHVQNLKKQVKPYQEEVDNYVAGQKLLSRHRYTFPQAWLYAEQVEGEWSALLDVLNRKDVAIQTQVSNLQTRIQDEDKLLEKHINVCNAPSISPIIISIYYVFLLFIMTFHPFTFPFAYFIYCFA